MFFKSQTIKLKLKELYKGKVVKEKQDDSKEKLLVFSLKLLACIKKEGFSFPWKRGAKKQRRNSGQIQSFLVHKIRILCLKG